VKRAAPLGALLLAACGWRPPCPTVSYTAGSASSVTVAVAESLLADTTEGSRGGVCLRLDGLASYEQVDQPDAEVALAERVATDPSIIVVVGQSGSRGSLAAAPVYAHAGLPQIVPTSTSSLLRITGPWTFVLVPPESAQARFIASALDSMRVHSVTLVYSGESYGEGMNTAMVRALAERRLALADQVRLGEDADIPTLTEASLRRHPSDAIVILGYYTEAGAVATLVERTRPKIRLLAADGAFYPGGLRRLAGAAAESLSIVSLWQPDTTDAATRRFLVRFRQVAGRDPTPSEALGVDALLLARAAIAAAGPSRSAVRAWLAGAGGSVPPAGSISRNTLHDGPTPRFALVRIGPPPVTAPLVK
jgi:branched-chain amino acid transport system substrate-binding protein